MRYFAFHAFVPNAPSAWRYVCIAVIASIICFAVPAHGDPLQSDKKKAIKKLMRQAAKLVKAGSLPAAEAELRSALDLDESRLDTKTELAHVLAKQRRLLDAYELSSSVVRSEPDNAHAWSVLGTTLLAGGRFTQARTILLNAIHLDKKEHLAWAGLGLLHFYENNIGDSLESLHKAVVLERDHPDYLFALGQVSARAERFNEAADAYNEFLKHSNIEDRERRERIRGLIRFLRYLGHSGRLYTNRGSDLTTVPFEMVGDRPVIKLKVNGRDEYLRFVLDTGSGISVLSEETAARLKIKPVARGGYAKGIGGDGKFPIVYGFLRQVEIGDVALRGVPVYIRKFHNPSHEVDGYIGISLISQFLTTINYGDQTFSLTKRDADTKEFADNIALSLPLRLTASGFLSGEVELPGIDGDLNFIVDTGASVSVISERVAMSSAISPFVNDRKLRVIGAAGVTDNVSTFLLPRVTFGGHTRSGILAVALDLDIINEASGFEQSGILGGNFLKNYRLTFDFRSSKVIFVPVGSEGVR